MQDTDQLFRAAVESSPTGVLVVDSAGTIRLANREVERLFGYDQRELLGQPLGRLIPSRSRAQHEQLHHQFVAHPSARPLGRGRDLTGLHKNGSEIPVEIGLRPVTTEQGEFTLASIIDISERKRAEQTLLERDERFSQLADSIREVYFVMTADYGETLYISPAYETVWGRTCQSLHENPHSFLDAVAPGDRERLVVSITEVLAGRDPGEVEFVVVRPDGEERTVLSHSHPIRDERGEVYRIGGVALDITDRKRAEAALHASEQQMRQLFETVNLIVLSLDAEGRVDYVNPFFLELTGDTREEAFGSDWFARFMPAAQRDQLRVTFRELLDTDAHRHFRNAIVTRAGDERMISWHNTTIRNADGHPIGTLSVGEDITEHLRLEQQFHQAQKMEAVGRLAGGIAHDFNNVLTVISGYSQLLLGSFPADDPRREDTAAISQAAASAAGLTRQLLAFSRQQVLEPRVLDLNDVVRNAEHMLRRTIGEDVLLATALASDLAPVRADVGQIEQVLMNLTVNARDAMPQGGQLTIETANVDLTQQHAWEGFPITPGSYVLLAVTDTGVGMDATVRARLFEPFYTTKEPGKGTGLGLATVYGIVKQSDGFIWVYSEPGAGSTFKIYLPRSSEAADEDVAPRAAPVGGSETILLVEDAPAVRTIARQALERAGYAVLEAPDGATALSLAARGDRRIALVLTDVVMPGMSGRELTEQLAAAGLAAPVLFMSGYTDDAIVRTGLLTGRIHYLPKPFNPDTLLHKVREILDRT